MSQSGSLKGNLKKNKQKHIELSEYEIQRMNICETHLNQQSEIYSTKRIAWKRGKSQINNLSSHLKNLGKQNRINANKKKRNKSRYQ